MAKNRPQIKPLQQPTAKPASPGKPKSSSSGGWFRFPVSHDKEILFDKVNFILIGLSIFLIILGFILMSGGNQDPKVFKADEIYSTRRITIAPIVVVSGFIVMVFAILKKPAGKTES